MKNIRLVPALFLFIVTCFVLIISYDHMLYKRKSKTSLSHFRLYSNKSALEIPCSPATRIVFIKTHKTGGSTVSSILGRYAYLHNLTMPKYKTTNNNKLFTRQMLEGQNNLHILASHTLYNRAEMDVVFGDAVYVTILRQPAAQFESSFGFFNISRKLHIENVDNPIKEFMRSPKKYMDTPGFTQSKKTWNDQFRILGLPRSKFKDKEFIRDNLKQLEFEFDLVMLNEYFDESLILLKNILCWTFEDILYFSKKVRSNRNILSKTLQDKIRSWNSADVLLYDYFNRTFWHKISEFGETFSAELYKFRKMRLATTDKCTSEYSEFGSNTVLDDGYPDLRHVQPREKLSEFERTFCINLFRDVNIFMQLMDSEKP